MVRRKAQHKTGASKSRGVRSKSGARSKKSSKAPLVLGPHIRFAATFSLAALFVWGLYSIAKVDLATEDQSSAAQHTDTRAERSREAENQNGSEYTFYSRLKDFEVEIPDDRLDIPEGETNQNVSYLIQAGSFRTVAQAEQQRAEMILLGLEPRVEKNINSRNETYYRVMLGPYTSRSTMANVRAALIENRFDAMVMKRKG